MAPQRELQGFDCCRARRLSCEPPVNCTGHDNPTFPWQTGEVHGEKPPIPPTTFIIVRTSTYTWSLMKLTVVASFLEAVERGQPRTREYVDPPALWQVGGGERDGANPIFGAD